ncbi:unnamed protein product [Camellia sinensis]
MDEFDLTNFSTIDKFHWMNLTSQNAMHISTNTMHIANFSAIGKFLWINLIGIIKALPKYVSKNATQKVIFTAIKKFLWMNLIGIIYALSKKYISQNKIHKVILKCIIQSINVISSTI